MYKPNTQQTIQLVYSYTQILKAVLLPQKAADEALFRGILIRAENGKFHEEYSFIFQNMRHFF